MRLCGIIAEYNPFHNGHALQIQKAREASACDYLIAVMDGGFSQRGEPCLLDKWTRTRMALMNGVDLVVELPALFAVRSADWFARGGVHTLRAMGCDCLSFGCETDDALLLQQMSRLLEEEPEPLRSAIQRGLAQGQTLARARGAALEQALALPEGTLDQPNLTLALEYLRASEGQMEVFPVRRIGDYHSESMGLFASASAIRARLARGEAVDEAVPEQTIHLLRSADRADPAVLDALTIYVLRAMGPAQAAQIDDIGEGLENRMIQIAGQVGGREQLIDSVKCKRYTRARISRLCAHALLGMTGEMTRTHPEPEYIRVLGFRKDAAPLLRHISRHTTLPFVTDSMRLKGNELFALEQRATDLQALCMGREENRRAGRDFSEPIVRV